MNLEAEKIGLIDITSEDDFLIDSHLGLDCSSFDLRLSVTCETQNDLITSLRRAKPRSSHGEEDAPLLSSSKEEENSQIRSRNINNECSLRKSLAWDRAFFTSAGFLELDELSLVNRGFKNPELLLSCENEASVRSKICHDASERCSSHNPAVRSGTRHRAQTFMNPKMSSPSNVAGKKDLSRRSSTIPEAVSKPNLVQRSAERRESKKSTRTMSQSKSSMTNTKKPPFRAGQSATSSRKLDLWSVSSVSTFKSTTMSSISSNTSVDFSSCSYEARSVNTWKLPTKQGECSTECSSPTSFDSQKSFSQGLTYDDNESQSLEQGILPTRIARKGPLFADTHRSSKPSSLRVPSQKIGFFDVKSEGPELRTSCPEPRARDISRSQCSKGNKPSNKSKEGPLTSMNRSSGIKCKKHPSEKQTGSLRKDEKENIFHHEDTGIELDMKSSAKISSQCSSSSEKHTRKPINRTKTSPAGAKIPYSIKGSPLKRSAFF